MSENFRSRLMNSIIGEPVSNIWKTISGMEACNV